MLCLTLTTLSPSPATTIKLPFSNPNPSHHVGYSELRTASGRIIHTVERDPDHGHLIPSEVFTSRGNITLQARDTRTIDNPKGRYRTGKDINCTYWEGPGSNIGGGMPVRGPYNPTGICAVPQQVRMENMYPHYGSMMPRDQGIAAAQLYYGQTTRGIDQHFHEPGYGTGVTGLYEHLHHHPHRSPAALQSGPLDPRRVSVLRAADSMLPHGHLARTHREVH